jgi:hypothetical protein
MNAMNATNRPDTDAMTLRAFSAEHADFDMAGLGVFSNLEAIELALVAGTAEKRLFCRLPSPLRLALRRCC